MSGRDQVVIYTSRQDAHADEVIRVLYELGEEVIRLNTEDIPLRSMMATELIDGRWHGEILVTDNGRVIDVDRVKSVWWRRPGLPVLPDSLSAWEREFAWGEIEQAFRGLFDSLDCFWMSHPDAISRAGWKLSQLQRAAALGFEVPRTLITNDPDQARQFHAACGGRVVFKVLTGPYLALDRFRDRHPDASLPEEELETSTMLLGPEHLEQLDSIQTVPTMFQTYVDKAVEYRVTVIGEDVFTAEIDSQANEATRIDSRLALETVPYRAVTLPEDVNEMCRRLVREDNLSYSAMDLVLTPDGRHVFLESNPNGQFRYIEDLLPELPLTATVAETLARGRAW